MRIGVDLGGTKIEVVAIEYGGREVLRRRVATPAGDYPATVEAVAALVEESERELQVRATVGIATPGAASRATGLMKNANSVVLNGKPLEHDLCVRLERPLRMANDANCFALSEASGGAGDGARCVFGAILGTGVGGGIAIDRHVLLGRNDIAGEWGHNPLPWRRADELPGPACYCGKHGCIETFLSGPGMARLFLERTGRVLSAREIATAAESGDTDACDEIETYCDRLARSLATVVNVLDPDAIVLGGGLSNVPALYARVPALMPAYVFTDGFSTPIRPPRFGDSSGVRGAAFLWPGER